MDAESSRQGGRYRSELLKEGYTGLGTLQGEFEDSNADRSSALGLRLFNGIVLAAGAAPVRVLIV